MKIPKKLKIGGHLITVDASKELKDKDGQFESKTNTIRICKTLAPTQKEVTLLHEIFHVLNSEFTHSVDRHAFMDSLAQQMHQVLKDNKMLR